ncbi:hypothetical protein NC651_002051 [Populus alba x Populus x berolinensis]|nr:hypothetical protein NC651_002051 [Populus alba x Populus x berolinensis]
MEHFRSKSCREGRIEMEGYDEDKAAPTNMQDLRSYSVSYAVSVQPNQSGKEGKMKKGKSNLGSSSKSWSFNDPELQRKRRVANYKVYAIEGKMKGSLRKSFRWIKDTCTQVVYGWRFACFLVQTRR